LEGHTEFDRSREPEINPFCSSRQQYDADTQVRSKPGENKGQKTTAVNNYINNITTLSDIYMGRDISFPPSISNGPQHHIASIENENFFI
jgi:hypothetical protein